MLTAARLKFYCSRPLSPTRRIALASQPIVSDDPVAAASLVGGLAAQRGAKLSAADRLALDRLVKASVAGVRLAQPQLRHRLQSDRIGLRAVGASLVVEGSRRGIELSKGDLASPLQILLAALYAARSLEGSDRSLALDWLRAGLWWEGSLIRFWRHVGGEAPVAVSSSLMWARSILGVDDQVSLRQVDQAYRSLMRSAHPDLGGCSASAADRIADLLAARDLLMRRAS